MSKQKVLNVQGVKKLILRPGDGPQAVTGAHVIFHYNGTLEDGTSFGSSYDSNPIDVTIGSEQTIKGLDLIFPTMCEGEKAKVIVPSELGFGMMENPHGFHASNKNIPSDSTLFFEIEMMEVDLPPKKETNSNELIEEARDLKDFGNNLFKKEDLERAIRKYNMALEKIKEIKKDTITTEQQNDMNLISLNCFNNLGVVTYKYGDYHMTIDYCTKALEIDPKNYKALYRLALAQKQKTEYSDAKKTLLRAAEIKNTKEIHDLFEEVRQLEGEYNNSSTQLYEGIFNEINTEGGLYKDQKPEPPAIVKCPECGEQVEEKQLARHTVKKHTPKKQYGGDIDL